MKKQAVNPYLPLGNYIPDGEPHVFGDRVYLFGSHDKEGGDTYCMLDYEFFSAPVDDLGNWTSKRINYSAKQDPLAEKTNRFYLYAPDCVRGNDGKFYLYYCLSGYRGVGGYHGPIGVAVCDTPDGKYEFLGHVKYADGTVCYDFVPFDPAVINDDGVIRLYYGTRYPFESLPLISRIATNKAQTVMFNKSMKQIKQGVMGAVHCTLNDDMLTIAEAPKLILPKSFKGTAMQSKMCTPPKNGQTMSGHGFFEGASIRKINGKYYFIYSSVNNHELCYCISKFPDRDFEYGGVIISTGDVGYKGRSAKDRVNNTGTTHGSIEKIGDNYYIFYHRLTNGSDYSRQGCAEKIEILKDGSIPAVEVTSCGLNNGDLKGEGTYSATICCQLTNGKMPHNSNSSHKNIPVVTFDGEDRFVRFTENSKAVYKYFDLSGTEFITLFARGKGKLSVQNSGEIYIDSEEFKTYKLSINAGKHTALEIKLISGKAEISEISFE